MIVCRRCDPTEYFKGPIPTMYANMRATKVTGYGVTRYTFQIPLKDLEGMNLLEIPGDLGLNEGTRVSVNGQYVCVEPGIVTPN